MARKACTRRKAPRPRSRARVQPGAHFPLTQVPSCSVIHPTVPETSRVGRKVGAAGGGTGDKHIAPLAWSSLETHSAIC